MSEAARQIGVYTPDTLADRWTCSSRHVRYLIARGELRAFKLGGKLLRINADAVQEFEQCRTTQSADSAASSPSSGMTPKDATVTSLAPATRAKLRDVRQAYTQR